MTAHRQTHQAGGSDPIKLDDLARPEDNTDLNATTLRHGLLPKLSGDATEYLDGSGVFSTPTGSGSGNVNAGSTLTARQVVLGDGSTDVRVVGSLGSAGDVLTSQGAGADPQWAAPSGGGALTLISEQTPSGTGVVSFTSLGSYRSLRIAGMGRGTQAATSVVLQITFNSDTGANYQNERHYANGTTSNAANATADAYIYGADLAAASAPANIPTYFDIDIPDYGGTTFYKTSMGRYNLRNGTGAATNYFAFAVASWWLNAAAITRVDLTLSAGNWDAGSRISCWGLT